MRRRVAARVLLAAAAAASASGPARGDGHAVAMHGAPRYGPDFAHLDYVNPAAPKGGTLRRAVAGSFDSLNPFIVKGVPAAGRALVFESLLKRSWDEPFTLYGLIAESVTVPDDRSSVTFALRPEARFHDGRPITVEDVVFSWRTLKEQGRPNHRLYYRKVRAIERPGPSSLRFVFDAASPDRELPLILGLMPILSKRYYDSARFAETTLAPPTGSGPYRVASVDPGRSIVYRRDPSYWGRRLPINRGQHNFDRIRFDYYRDGTAMLEAFRAGEHDLRIENSSVRWATAYDFPAAADGRVKREALAHGRPSGVFALVFNARRAIFADRAVRRALAHAFDFDWVNRVLLHGAYTRTRSLFDNSELAARGVPEGRELALLEPFRARLPDALFTRPYRPPGEARGLRANLVAARRLLAKAGWRVRDGALRSPAGRPMRFEILLANPETEKIALAFARNLDRLGVEARVRTVDTAQHRYRLGVYDFDMTVHRWGVSLSPGNEQAYYWGSTAAAREGTRNYPGVREPAVDALIARMTRARRRDTLVAAARAMDRILMWEHYFIPLYHLAEDRLAYWDGLRRPAVTPLYGAVLETWWRAPPETGRRPR